MKPVPDFGHPVAVFVRLVNSSDRRAPRATELQISAFRAVDQRQLALELLNLGRSPEQIAGVITAGFPRVMYPAREPWGILVHRRAASR